MVRLFLNSHISFLLLKKTMPKIIEKTVVVATHLNIPPVLSFPRQTTRSRSPVHHYCAPEIAFFRSPFPFILPSLLPQPNPSQTSPSFTTENNHGINSIFYFIPFFLPPVFHHPKRIIMDFRSPLLCHALCVALYFGLFVIVTSWCIYVQSSVDEPSSYTPPLKLLSSSPSASQQRHCSKPFTSTHGQLWW